MKPEKGGGSELEDGEADLVAMETEELVKWVGLMVLEARGPGGPKQCQEGPHCPKPQGSTRHPSHVCNPNSDQCGRAKELTWNVARSLKNHVPVCIDVVLFPSCSHGRKQAQHLSPHFSLVKEPAILLERWTISVEQKRHMGEKVEGVGSTFGLMSAVRSQLYFSQLSSWIQTHPDGLPLSVAYRVAAPGEAGLKTFVETPVTKTLPTVDFKYSFLKVSVSELPRKEDNAIFLLHCADSTAQMPEVANPNRRPWKEFEDKPTIHEGAVSLDWPLQGRPGNGATPTFQHPPRPMSFVQDGIRFKQRSSFVPGDVIKRSPVGAAVKHEMRRELTLPLEKPPSGGLKVPHKGSSMKRLYSPNVLVTSDQDSMVTQVYGQLTPEGCYYPGGLETTYGTKAGLCEEDVGFPGSFTGLGASPCRPLKTSPCEFYPSPMQDLQKGRNQTGAGMCPPQSAVKLTPWEKKTGKMSWMTHFMLKDYALDYEGDAEDGIPPSEGTNFYLGEEDLPQAQSQTSDPAAGACPTWRKSPFNSSMETPQPASCTHSTNQSGSKTSGGKKKRNRRRKRGKKEELEQKEKAEEKPQSREPPAPPPMPREEKGPQERKPLDFRTDAAPRRGVERISRIDKHRNFADSMPQSRDPGAKHRLRNWSVRYSIGDIRPILYKSKEAEHLEERRDSRRSQDSTRRKSTSSELECERWQKSKQEGSLSLSSTPPIQQQSAPQTDTPQVSAQNTQTPPDKLVSALLEALPDVVTEDPMKRDEEGDDDDDEEFELSSLDEDSDIEVLCNPPFQTIEASTAGSHPSEETAKSSQGIGFTESKDIVSQPVWVKGPPRENIGSQQLKKAAWSAGPSATPAQTSHNKFSFPPSSSRPGGPTDQTCKYVLNKNSWLKLTEASAQPSYSEVVSTGLGSRCRDSHSNIPEFNQDSAVCLPPRDVRTGAVADSEQDRTDSAIDSEQDRTASDLTDVFNWRLELKEREPSVWIRDHDIDRKPQQTVDIVKNTPRKFAKVLSRNEPATLDASNEFATSLDASRNRTPSEKIVPARKSLAGKHTTLKCIPSRPPLSKADRGVLNKRTGEECMQQTNGFSPSDTSSTAASGQTSTAKSPHPLMQNSLHTKCCQDADENWPTIYMAEWISKKHCLPGANNLASKRWADGTTVGDSSQEEPLHQTEEALQCAGPEIQETSGLKTGHDPLSLNSSLETLVGSLPKGEHFTNAKVENFRAAFYEPDSSEDGDLLSGAASSTVLGEFTTKDDLSALFLAKQFGNDNEVSDEVFAKSSPPSPVKPGPGREEDVLLRSSPSKGGRTSLKRPRSESSKLPEVLSAVEACAHRQHLRKSHSLIFNGRTSLPSQSSPAPVKRKSMNNFGFDDSLTKPRAISSALSCSRLASDDDQEEGEDNTRTLSTSAPASTNCLLGNFEESVLNGRIEPMGIVEGFTAEIGASGSFCPKHKIVPVTAYFFKLSDDNAPSPYLGHINLQTLGKKGYHVPKKGTLQVTLFNPSKTVVKMFVVLYDLSEMPPHCQTFLRQRTLYQPADSASTEPSYLRYLIHLRFASSGSGRVYLHTDIRLIFARDKFELDSKVSQYELRSYTECPKNPKFSRRR